MRIIPDTEEMELAVIDPKKSYGEPGQYTKHAGPMSCLQTTAEIARAAGCELRWYYKSLETADGEPVASQVIVTEIPPGHVQPFHTHHRIHEMTIVEKGQIIAVDSETLTEADLAELGEVGRIVSAGQMVIEGPGTRHTILNWTDSYARLYTIQTARIGLSEFPHDWHRDKPVE